MNREVITHLLPCPFCGHEKPEMVRLGTGRKSCQIACGYCGASHESADEHDQSGSSWNTRADLAQSVHAFKANLTAEIVRLNKAIEALAQHAQPIPTREQLAQHLRDRACGGSNYNRVLSHAADVLLGGDAMSREVMQMALEALLDFEQNGRTDKAMVQGDAAIVALRTAIAPPSLTRLEEDDAAAHMYPSDLKILERGENVARAWSIKVGNENEESVPLFTLAQIKAAWPQPVQPKETK